MKKLILFVATLPLMFASCEEESGKTPPPLPPPAPPTYKISEQFPDKNLQRVVAEQFDADKDGMLSEKEVGLVFRLHCSNEYIESMAGIEIFKGLMDLDCSRNPLDRINVITFPLLRDFNCSRTQIYTLDITNNLSLEMLVCNDSDIHEIKVSNTKYQSIEKFDCSYNELTTVEFFALMPQLKAINCSGNDNIVVVDVSLCSRLESVFAQRCSLLKNVFYLSGYSLTPNSIFVDSGTNVIDVNNDIY